MVVRLRLARHGRRNRAFYRIVAADSRCRRDGRHLEILGFYDPIVHSYQEKATSLKRVALNVPRIKYWLSVGAQPSDTVGRLLGSSGLLPQFPRSYAESSTDQGKGGIAFQSSEEGLNNLEEENVGSEGAKLEASKKGTGTIPSSRGLGTALFDDAPGPLDGVRLRSRLDGVQLRSAAPKLL